MPMLLGGLFSVIFLLIFWIIGSYNRLVSLRNQALNGWRQIDVQLKRRHDLIPNLVNAVRGSMDFERDTLTAVMEARSKALTATGPADAAIRSGRQVEHVYRRAMSALLTESDLRVVTGRRELYRRMSRIADLVNAVADRVWYAVVKEA